MKNAELVSGNAPRTKAKRHAQKRRSLFMESLEDRRLLTVLAPGFTESLYSAGLNRPVELAVDNDSGTIVFSRASTRGPFYRLDTDLTVTNLGGIPGGHPYVASDIEFNDGLAYTTNFGRQLVQIDPTTGADAVLTGFFGASNEQGIAIKDDVVFATGGNVGGRFWSFDLNTSQKTLLATNFPRGSRGLEYVANTDQFFMATAGRGIYEVFEDGSFQHLHNVTTGQANMAVDAAATFAYVTNNGRVDQIDVATGQVTRFAVSGGEFGSISSLDDLAFGPASSGLGVSLYVTNYTGLRIVEISGDFPQDNSPPVAVDDAYATDEDTPLVVIASGVLANDSDPDGNTLTVTADTGPTNGSLVLNSDGSFTFTPDPDFHGTDSFTYIVDDGNGGTDTATVEITVNSVIDAVIDVKPGNGDAIDPINLSSKGRTPIAILATQTANGDADEFDPNAIDLALMTFKINGESIAPEKMTLEDVDGDGDLDLLLHFLTADLADILASDATELALTAEFGGDALGNDLGGSDAIKVVPPKGKGNNKGSFQVPGRFLWLHREVIT